MKKYLVAGLLFWLPIWVTVVIVRFIVNTLDNIWVFFPAQWHPTHIFGRDIPGFGLFITFILLILTGVLVTNYLGSRIVGLSERLLAKIPLIRSIYGTVKQAASAIFTTNSKAFKQAVLVEFPRKGAFSIGFQTNDHFPQAPSDKKHITVFVPTTPNPTSGFFVIVAEDEVHQLDMTVEDALKMIISLGVINPAQLAQQARKPSESKSDTQD